MGEQLISGALSAMELDVAADQSLRHEVRLIARVELVAEVLNVPLDGPRSDAEFLGTLLRGESASDAMQHLAFSFGETDKVFLLARDIHHLLRNRKSA